MSRLVGREDDAARLRAFLARLADGPSALVVEGEPGIGKMALFEAAVEHAVGLRPLRRGGVWVGVWRSGGSAQPGDRIGVAGVAVAMAAGGRGRAGPCRARTGRGGACGCQKFLVGAELQVRLRSHPPAMIGA